jgi:hypothetical protein
MKPQCWLWPDRVIGKRESRLLREEHNRVVNFNAELLAALERVRFHPNNLTGRDWALISAALVKARE